eukprot:TRINITY_DN16377_c0_g1_i1.p1 TRINITY_DN16377_c0_g1~~TRINITY_DN16377_c0_g1_i1.p1  ORF type:complete len:173 (+),score=20.24 TRINITY_DN16377_c0_g1_i1:156-674(+)
MALRDGVPVAWAQLEDNERWAESRVDALALASEEEIDEQVSTRRRCPMCSEGFITGPIVMMPPTNEMAHRECTLGFLALCRSVIAAPGASAAGEAAQEPTRRKDSKQIENLIKQKQFGPFLQLVQEHWPPGQPRSPLYVFWCRNRSKLVPLMILGVGFYVSWYIDTLRREAT